MSPHLTHLQPVATMHSSGQVLSSIHIGPRADVFLACLPDTISLPTTEYIPPTFVRVAGLPQAIHALDYYFLHHQWPL